MPASAVSGALLLAPWAWTFGADLMRLMLGRQSEADRVQAETALYAVRRHHTSGAVLAAPRRFSPLATPFGRVLLVAWIALLVVRLQTSSGLALLLALGVIIAGTLIFVVRYAQLSQQTRIYPLAGRGPSVVQAPSRKVVLHVEADALHVADTSGQAVPCTIPVADIIALEPLENLSAMARTGLGVVTRDAPIILTGRAVAADPAIVELRRRLAQPRS